MKVNIIKGPLFEERREQAYEYLYQIIKRKTRENGERTEKPFHHSGTKPFH